MNAMLIFVLTISIGNAEPKPTVKSPQVNEQAAALVKQLGHTRYSVREAAAKNLAELGADALAALEVGAKSTDQEVHVRCKALLPGAWDAEWKRRADAYFADTEGKAKHELPLLAHWNNVIGKPTAGSRELFAEIVRSNGNLLRLAEVDYVRARDALMIRSNQILEITETTGTRDGEVSETAIDAAAILFLQSVVGGDSVASRFGVSGTPPYLLYRPSVLAATKSKDVGRPYRLVISGWMRSRPLTDSVAVYVFTELAYFRPMPEAVEQLARIVNGTKETSRGNALAAITRTGTEDAKRALTAMLGDTSWMSLKVGRNEISHVQDCALANLIKLKGENPADYGLRRVNRWNLKRSTGPVENGVVELYGFYTDEDRDKALKKWKAGLPKN